MDTIFSADIITTTPSVRKMVLRRRPLNIIRLAVAKEQIIKKQATSSPITVLLEIHPRQCYSALLSGRDDRTALVWRIGVPSIPPTPATPSTPPLHHDTSVLHLVSHFCGIKWIIETFNNGRPKPPVHKKRQIQFSKANNQGRRIYSNRKIPTSILYSPHRSWRRRY